MAISRIHGTGYWYDNQEFASITLPAGSIGNTDIEAAAGIVVSKLQQQRVFEYRQVGTSVTETVPLGIARGTTGTTVDVVVASLVAPLSGATVTVDVKKNGTAILSGVVTLNDTHSNYEVVVGTISVTAVADEDVFEAVITATVGGGTLPTGVMIQMLINEPAL